MRSNLLGGLSPREFLRRHWQKKPLLVRGALPEFVDAIDPARIFALACRDDIESRLVQHDGKRWRVRHGPFAKSALARLPRSGWSLLVQGTDHFSARARELLDRFAFVPYARLDDVMISVSPPGAGVGPHFDSYDVFLLQMSGTRRWQASHQGDLELVADAPLRLLADFRPTSEWLLEPGDMLYLPPGWAHDGVSVSRCMTCSIGFRAPDARELATRFVDFLHDRIDLDDRYRDPDLRATRRPAEIGAAMLRTAHAWLGTLRWNAADELTFLGEYLTEPKPHVVYARPARPHAANVFRGKVARNGIRLHPRSQMLYRDGAVFINGECHRVRKSSVRPLLALADRRRLPPQSRLGDAALELLYQWYRAGYIVIDTGAQEDSDGRTRQRGIPDA